MQRVAGTPIAIDGVQRTVTASIGYCAFPLQPFQMPMSWERAANLVDMALYIAKNQGRNRAVGVLAVQADSPAILAEIEADFESAYTAALVQLAINLGPSA